MAKQLTPISEGQRVVLDRIRKIREVMEREGVSEDGQDAVLGCLVDIFLQHDFDIHMNIIFAEKIEELVGDQFEETYYAIRDEAQAATDDDAADIQDYADAAKGINKPAGDMS